MTGDEIIALINNPTTTLTINRDRGSSSFMSKAEHHKVSLTDHHDWKSVLSAMGVTSLSMVGGSGLFHGGVTLGSGNGISITESVPNNGLVIAVDPAFLDAAYVKKGGDNMSGPLGIIIPGGNNFLTLSSGDGTPTYRNSGIELEHNGIRRWRIRKNNSAAGHLHIDRYDSAGTYVSRAIQFRGDREEAILNDSLRIRGTYKHSGGLYAGSVDPSHTTRMNYDGYMWSLRFYNAVYNDIADFIEVPEGTVIKYGFPYYVESTGKVRVCRKGERSIGIATDTYGLSTGISSNKTQMPISVGGFALAHVDDSCKFMDPLVVGKSGMLTKAGVIDKIFRRDNIVGWFYKKEKSDSIYNDTVSVNGRSWVKVR